MTESSGTAQNTTGHAFEAFTLSVDDIGGIDRCDVSLSADVTILEGRNATNRTSFLTALADVLGGSAASLKTDAEAGKIRLSIDDDEYEREYERTNGGLSSVGEQFTDQRELVDLFVRLLEDNPVRRAVAQGINLREYLLEPVDTDEIERRLNALERERTEIDQDLQRIDRNRQRLPDLEQRRTDLEAQREEIAESIEAIEETIEEFDVTVAETEQAEELLDDLDRHHQKLQTVESSLDQQDRRLEELRAERGALEDEVEEITVPETEIAAIEDELQQLRQEKQSIDSTIADIQQIIRFNEGLVSGEMDETLEVATEDITTELDPSKQQVECWTCGSDVEQGDIADRLEELRNVVQGSREERMELQGNIRELEKRATDLRRTGDRQAEIKRKLERVEEQIEIREEKRTDLTAQQEELTDEISEIEARVEETEELRDNDLVDAYQRLSELEYQRGQIEQELADTSEEIEEIEELAAERAQLEAQREETADDIDRLRSRIDDLEERAIEEFNEHMETLLQVLDFENIARVWIERRKSEKRDGGATFELHIIRETPDGSVYEDTVETLSESEREVIGLVVALAGYLAHEVYDAVPFMLLDSLEAIDAKRLDALVEYFSDYVPFLIVALLPEDAAELSDEYDYVTATELAD